MGGGGVDLVGKAKRGAERTQQPGNKKWGRVGGGGRLWGMF